MELHVNIYCGKCVISGFSHEADKTCALLGCYAASSGVLGKPICPIFKGHLFLGFSTLEDGTDRLSWNFYKELPLLSA